MMALKRISHLGPTGTYAEAAAITYARLLQQQVQQASELCPYATIAQTLQAIADRQVDLGVVPVENSIEGSVPMTLDSLWQLEHLQIQQALVLPISHALISLAADISTIRQVYSHPQALAQCQHWLASHLPQVEQIPTHSTTEALQLLPQKREIAAIASQRAAQMYELPILAYPINDHPDNCTRFWVLSLAPSPGGSHTSLAFSVQANVPGALMKPLQVFADRGINLSRIESRPTKRSLGDYLFFMDLETDATQPLMQSALEELKQHTEKLKVFGSYPIVFP